MSREPDDHIAAFFEARVVITLRSEDVLRTGDIYAGYVSFCRATAVTPLAEPTFSRRLPSHAHRLGILKGKSSFVTYAGLGLLNPDS